MKVPSAMTIPLIILAILSVVGGFVGIPEIFMKDGDKLAEFFIARFSWFEKFMKRMCCITATELTLMVYLSCVGIAGRYLCMVTSSAKILSSAEAKGIWKILANKWYVDELYDTVIVKP